MIDLDAIQARADAATDGPWAWEATGEKDNSWAVGLVLDEDDNPLSGQIDYDQGVVIEGICENGSDGHFADAAFIAASRTDVPALVAELRGARGIRAEMRRLYEDPTPQLSHPILLYLLNKWDQLTGEATDAS